MGESNSSAIGSFEWCGPTEDVALQNLIHWIVSHCIIIVVVFGAAAASKSIMFQFLFVG